jgi:D-serine deaminase-like pyridoxal phosphate-dependent protein
VALRPHWKTHKCVEIARLQVERGAAGGTVAKPGEAEVFLDAGFRDLVVATPVVDPAKMDRLLGRSGEARLGVLVESPEGVERWSGAAARAGRVVDVLIEVDTGLGRTGVRPGEPAVELARAIAGAKGLRLRGLLTHAGHGYGAGTPEDLARIGREEGEVLVATADAVRRSDLRCEVVSVGSTPTVRISARVPGVTEARPGNYVFHDGIQVGLGVVPEARCALTVLATVVSRSGGRVVVDTGSKTLTTDRARGDAAGFGTVADRPGLAVARVWEEHGLLEGGSGADLKVGERVRIVPNHACTAVNLHERLIAVRAGTVEAVWEVAARGRVE